MSLTTKEVCICDQCGRERDKDTNHWWLLTSSIVGLVTSQKLPGMAATTWNDASAHIAGVQHLCGRACLYKAIDKLAREILQQERVKA